MFRSATFRPRSRSPGKIDVLKRRCCQEFLEAICLGCAKTLPQECAGFGCPDRILKRFGDLANEAGIILANVNLKTHDAALFLATAIGG